MAGSSTSLRLIVPYSAIGVGAILALIGGFLAFRKEEEPAA